jgi:hypothetical protein
MSEGESVFILFLTRLYAKVAPPSPIHLNIVVRIQLQGKLHLHLLIQSPSTVWYKVH